MAFNPKAHEPVRLEYHAARLFLRQDIHGKDKTYGLIKKISDLDEEALKHIQARL